LALVEFLFIFKENEITYVCAYRCFASKYYYLYKATDLLCQRITGSDPTGVARRRHSALIFIYEINTWKNTAYCCDVPFLAAIRVTAKSYFF
jgi:hypothetical protein